MPTSQTVINVTSTAVTVIPVDPNRRYMLIHNYFSSNQTIWVLFVPTNAPTQVATCGNAGELEIPAGYTIEFGVNRLISPSGLIANNQTFQQPNCPTEAVSIIAGALGVPAGTGSGGIMVMSP